MVFLCNEELNTLTSFRSNCTRGIKSNFRKMFTTKECPLQCNNEAPQIDNPSHILQCKKLRSTPLGEDINKIYGTIVEQEAISRVLCKLMRKRTMLLEALSSDLPGVILDSSLPRGAAVFPSV